MCLKTNKKVTRDDKRKAAAVALENGDEDEVVRNANQPNEPI